MGNRLVLGERDLDQVALRVRDGLGCGRHDLLALAHANANTALPVPDGHDGAKVEDVTTFDDLGDAANLGKGKGNNECYGGGEDAKMKWLTSIRRSSMPSALSSPLNFSACFS
mmetsp:Transcript_13529/g.34028  ORF Transcript_13529/g.34028 Transcript_13529/m.34028 type:complete len:113 (-) Transcript_13529:479-817(-)